MSSREPRIVRPFEPVIFVQAAEVADDLKAELPLGHDLVGECLGFFTRADDQHLTSHPAVRPKPAQVLAQSVAQGNRHQRLANDEQDDEQPTRVVDAEQVQDAEQRHGGDYSGTNNADRLASEADMRSQPIQPEQPQAGDPADAIRYGGGSLVEVQVPLRVRVDHLEANRRRGG